MNESMLDIKEIEGGITAPEGYKAAGMACGIKKSGKKDLALIYSENTATGAALFTTNLFKAAPLLLSMEKIRDNGIRAILVNSGNANSCTGEQGLADARELTVYLAEKLGIDADEVYMSSTGVIGELLPVDKIKKGIDELTGKISRDGSGDAAEAIMTTDTRKKEIAYSFRLPSDGTVVKVGGMAKGSGMIEPNLATMLAYITTDLAIEKALLQKALKVVGDKSFNRISVDGDCSTNDSVFLLANGKAGNRLITEENEDYLAFLHVLEKAAVYLAKSIVMDGEGATRFITIRIKGAGSEEEGLQIARRVANSNLVKTACFGGDPNWGRIVVALGSCNLDLEKEDIEISINDKLLFSKEEPVYRDKGELARLMEGKYIDIEINLNKGKEDLEFWTSDLTYDYVKINAEYHT
ncbi:MAG: bifunctional glutamate N-acetyltransferase/amino-acid acetyltransferase ArgJ [Halanaerobiales bacterium]